MKSLVALANENQSNIESTYFRKWARNTIEKNAKYFLDDIIANSQAMKDVLYIAKRISKMNDPVHIFGETGTGKSVLAQSIHNDSFNKEGPYLNINCSAWPKELLERELFGIEANGQTTPGLFELANGGTLCIEEIDELSISMQGRLLQVIEEGQVIRMGGHHPVPVRVRMITTSNMDLSLLVDQDSFRKDLFYQLSVLTCKMPTLSEREEDFESLIETYLHSHLHREDLIIPQNMIELLKQYSWPGNVRELFNALSYMACLEEKELTLESLPFYIKGRLLNNSTEEMSESDVNELIKRIEEHGFWEKVSQFLTSSPKVRNNALLLGALSLEKTAGARYHPFRTTVAITIGSAESIAFIKCSPGTFRNYYLKKRGTFLEKDG